MTRIMISKMREEIGMNLISVSSLHFFLNVPILYSIIHRRVRAILSKKTQRQAATFYEHGAVNRILARTEEELGIFSKVDRRRRVS